MKGNAGEIAARLNIVNAEIAVPGLALLGTFKANRNRHTRKDWNI